MRRLLLAVLFIMPQEPGIQGLVDEYFTASEARRKEIAAALAAQKFADVESAVRKRPEPVRSGPGQVLSRPVRTSHGESTYLVVLPLAYDGTKDWPALLSLH